MPSLDANPRFVTFTLRTDCPRCGAHLPINGLAPKADCAECGHGIEVPDKVLRSLLSSAEEDWPRPQPSGRIPDGDLTWRWTAEPLDVPACARCGTALDPHASEAILACPACAHTSGSAALAGPQQYGVQTARRLYGGHTDLTRPAIAPSPVALACPQCGGSLSIGANRARLTPCDYCATPIHLPDLVWRQLHPPREVQPWTVRFEGEGVAAKRARIRREEAHKKDEQKRAQTKKRAERAAREGKQREAREQERRARQSAADKARHAQQIRAGRAVVGAWLLTLGAATIIVPFWVAWGLGLFVGAPPGWGRVPIVLGLVSILIAWPAAVAAAAWRGRVPVGRSLLQSAFHLVMLMMPVIGVGAAIWLIGPYASGRMPTPFGEDYKKHRHPRGAAWPATVLVVLIAGFSLVSTSVITGANLLEMLAWFAED